MPYTVKLVAVATLLMSLALAKPEHGDFHHHEHDDLLEVLHFQDGKPSKSTPKKQAPEEDTKPSKPHHVCIHDEVKMAPEKIPVTPQRYADGRPAGANGSSAREFQPLAYSNIRFQAFFDVDGKGSCTAAGRSVNTYRGTTAECAASEVLTSVMKDYIMNVLVAEAMGFMSAALNVNPVVGNLIMSDAECNTITIPEDHRTAGIASADMVLYITAVPLATNSQSQTVAWATTCARDGSGRPTAGHINFVPSALSNAAIRNEVTQHNDIMTAIHEMCHAMGYSAPFFNYGYLNQAGARILDGSGITVFDSDATLGKGITKMTSPRVRARARTFFNCPTLDGVEIEDQGGAGTGGSHWEKRILYQEFIAGILSTVKTFFSSLTLAFFEDTGFYTANYGVAQDAQMNWGRNRSCTFLQQKCNSQQITSREFCFDENPKSRYCTFDRLGKGYCGVSEYSTALPAHFQYFSSPLKGSAVSLSDFCPAVLPFSNIICVDSSASDSQDIFGSTYSPQSRCFESNLISTDFGVSSGSDARCFTYVCEGSQLIIGVKGQSAACPADGSAGNADISTLRGYHGNIVCPPASELCAPLGPTPAPTPAPPVPPVPPAAPGYTPAPPPTFRPATPAPRLATTCAARITCANNLPSFMPFCRRMADALLSCFGTTCAAELGAWLGARSLTCSNAATYGEERCVEGFIGGVAMCALTS
jgi:leishmanolysin